LGLRTELTDWKITYTGLPTDYYIYRWDFFPSIHFSFNITDKQQLTTSYTRRIQRPRGYYLEPYKTYTDAYNVRQGNPGIQPEYIDSYELGYQLQLTKGFVSAEIYRRKTNDKIDQIKSVYSDKVMLQTFANIGKDFSTGVELMLNYKPADWWSFNLMGNLYRYRIVGNLNGRDVDQSSTNWNARLSNTFNLTKTTKLQIDGMYNSPTTSAQGSRDGFAFTNVALRQDLFKNKLNVTFTVRDVLNTAKFGFKSSGPDFYSKSKFDMKSPIFSLTLSFKINNYKQQKQRDEVENGGNGEMNGMDTSGGNE
jgi:outer membrane receptor protein involved in Fe transport